MFLPSTISHSFTLLSSLELASTFESGRQLTAVIAALWPRRSRYSRAVSASQTSSPALRSAVANLAGNAVVAAGLERVAGYVAEGNSLSAGLDRAGLFPPLVVRMVRMCEDIGKLDEALRNVSYFYNREVRESVERLQTLIEPAMTVVLGLLLGWVVLSVLGPIYDTISQLGA